MKDLKRRQADMRERWLRPGPEALSSAPEVEGRAAIHFAFSIQPQNIKNWTPDRIARLFRGVAEVILAIEDKAA